MGVSKDLEVTDKERMGFMEIFGTMTIIHIPGIVEMEAGRTDMITTWIFFGIQARMRYVLEMCSTILQSLQS